MTFDSSGQTMERSDLHIRRWAFDFQCSTFSSILLGYMSHRIGPNRFGSFGLRPRFNLLQLYSRRQAIDYG